MKTEPQEVKQEPMDMEVVEERQDGCTSVQQQVEKPQDIQPKTWLTTMDIPEEVTPPRTPESEKETLNNNRIEFISAETNSKDNAKTTSCSQCKLVLPEKDRLGLIFAHSTTFAHKLKK